MGARNWEQEYDRVLAQAVDAGRLQILPSGSEKRRRPRFKLQGAEILVTEQVPHEIVDLSASGLAFYADRPFTVGTAIMVSLRKILAIGAEVLGCDPLSGTDAPAPYKIRCRFADEDYGLRFLVMTLEIEGERDA